MGDEAVSSQPSPPRHAGVVSWSDNAKGPAAVFTNQHVVTAALKYET
jgi:hypothetical protein